MNEPIISVIIPAYQCQSTIHDAVTSALAQDVSLEIIIVNNDTQNGELAKVLHLFAENPKIRIIENTKDTGAANGRNIGVAAARGEYIAFLDSDDIWREGKLKQQLHLLQSTDAPICCTARELMSPDGTLTGRTIPVKESISYQSLLSHNSINCSSVVLKKKIALEFPMECEDAHEDYITWLKIVKKYGAAVGINKPLLQYRLSNTGKSGSKLHSARLTYRVYRHTGHNTFVSCLLFVRYAFHGVLKYLLA